MPLVRSHSHSINIIVCLKSITVFHIHTQMLLSYTLMAKSVSKQQAVTSAAPRAHCNDYFGEDVDMVCCIGMIDGFNIHTSLFHIISLFVRVFSLSLAGFARVRWLTPC